MAKIGIKCLTYAPFVSGGDGNNNPGSTENDGNDWEDDGDDDGKWN